MNVALAIQGALTEQRSRDLIAISQWVPQARQIIIECGHDIGEPVVVLRRPCTACSFWRSQLDDALAEVDDLRDQLRRRGITPQTRQDGEQASYGPLSA